MKRLDCRPADLSHLEKAIAAHLTGLIGPHLTGLGVKHDLERWLAAEHGEMTISCLSGAPVVEFLAPSLVAKNGM
jgi:hypothetical protein